MSPHPTGVCTGQSPSLPTPDTSVMASTTAARALLSVFCKGLFKNVETNIPQELNISPQGEEKSYKNIYHSARGQGRGGGARPSGKQEGGWREGWELQQNKTEWQGEDKRGERNSRRGERARRETMVRDGSRERENKGKEGVESCQTVKEGGPPLLS